MTDSRKRRGAYYTPPAVAAELVRWAVRRESDRMLDPACGDGRFLALHRRSFGVDADEGAVAGAASRAPRADLHHADFFRWAAATGERFHCATGNPPFIRYQRFSGDTRRRAQSLCAALGAPVSGLVSSWVPYLIVTASLLGRGGRMAFVVPAEIGHAPYAAPLLRFLAARFDSVRVVAVRDKVFPDLSEDVWFLYADGFGGSTDALSFAATDRFSARCASLRGIRVNLDEWLRWGCRLRPLLLPADVASEYRRIVSLPDARRLGDFARVGIGYVSGDNDFFHLRPSRARALDIPPACLQPVVRGGKDLHHGAITKATVNRWKDDDDENFLLRLERRQPVSPAIRRYLESDDGRRAEKRYKCRIRTPWYSVPNVTAPDLFLSTMSTTQPLLVENRAGCACTNAVHAVRLRNGVPPAALRQHWRTSLTALSCEIEGHPLGGGVLKLEPREALRVALRADALNPESKPLFQKGVEVLRAWRHRA